MRSQSHFPARTRGHLRAARDGSNEAAGWVGFLHGGCGPRDRGNQGDDAPGAEGGAENVVREKTGVAREGVRAWTGFPRARPALGPRADSIRRVSGPVRRAGSAAGRWQVGSGQSQDATARALRRDAPRGAGQAMPGVPTPSAAGATDPAPAHALAGPRRPRNLSAAGPQPSAMARARGPRRGSGNDVVREERGCYAGFSHRDGVRSRAAAGFGPGRGGDRRSPAGGTQTGASL